MRAFGLGVLAAAAIAAAPGFAAENKLDLKQVTCKEFLASGKDNIAVIMTWLDAYYLGKDDPPVIDFDRMAKAGTAMGKYCGAHDDASVAKAADTVWGK